MTAIQLGLKSDDSPSALAKRLAGESGWERKDIYRHITGQKK
jgi:hypothetical protein